MSMLRTLRTLFGLGVLGLSGAGWSCATSLDGSQASPSNQPGVEQHSHAKSTPTESTARAFLEEVERDLLRLWVDAGRASWVKQTYITEDTTLLAAQADERVMEYMARRAKEAVQFDELTLPEEMARRFKLLKLSQTLPAPSDADRRAELARIATELDSMYGKGKYCGKDGKCLDLGALSKIIGESRKYDELLDAWKGWRTIAKLMRDRFVRYVELANEGARELGFANLGDLWRSNYDMAPDAFEKELDRLWEQVKPLYTDLHCYTRHRLGLRYGKDKVPENEPIPAHLLGNMWSQDWSYLVDLLLPSQGQGINFERALKQRKVDEREMVRYGERFFVSLGMDALPETFWKWSMFTKPAERDVVCHASAWNVDYDKDLRIKMCIEINGEDFTTIHHELGHNYYQYYYRELPLLFRGSANDGFHEGLGDTIALSVTPTYLKRIGLISELPKDEIGPLMQTALGKVAFLPFGLLIDKWRWDVFSGKVPPEKYNAAWWELSRKYQGIKPPMERTEENFDPGAKYHIPANVPYMRYFLAHILQFQFHRALCTVAGHKGPLHTCSIYENKEAGKRLIDMMAMGQSRPWPDALKSLTGEEQMDASAILSYFQPLHDWLKVQNKGRQCGW